jgi:hypothetical protein
MKNRTGHEPSSGRKRLLATARFLGLVSPVVIGVMNAPSILEAQSGPAFDVASVKPHGPGDRHFALPQFSPAGRFSVAGVPLQIVIAFAYNLPFQGTQISGGPDWLRSPEGVYDIEAKADADALKGLSHRALENKMRLMLQAFGPKATCNPDRRGRLERPGERVPPNPPAWKPRWTIWPNDALLVQSSKSPDNTHYRKQSRQRLE